MDCKLELVVLPVSDVDRAKAFYADRAGFTVDLAAEHVDVSDVEVFPWGSFVHFSDADGDGWSVQQLPAGGWPGNPRSGASPPARQPCPDPGGEPTGRSV